MIGLVYPYLVFHANEMSKRPFYGRDDRLHASLCIMECSFMGFKLMSKPKPVLSLSEGF